MLAILDVPSDRRRLEEDAGVGLHPTLSTSFLLFPSLTPCLFSLSLCASSHSLSSMSFTSLPGVLKSLMRTLSPNPYRSRIPSARPSDSNRTFFAFRKVERRA